MGEQLPERGLIEERRGQLPPAAAASTTSSTLHSSLQSVWWPGSVAGIDGAGVWCWQRKEGEPQFSKLAVASRSADKFAASSV